MDNELYGYTFYPEFEEHIVLYRGVASVKIGNGETIEGVTYKPGVLYAEYIDGMIQEVGPVSDYYYAIESGYQGTPEEWVNYILSMPGVLDDTVTAKNAAEAAQTAAETAQGLAETAQTAAETAQGLAEQAQSRAETAQGLAETAQSRAETAQGLAEQAQTAAETAQGLAEQAQSLAETAQTAAETAQGKAEDAQVAAELAQSKAETAQSLSEAARDASEGSKNSSEAWAVGQIDGTDVPSDDPRYHNNSKYYSQVANNSQTAAEAAQALAETAQGLAEAAQSAAETAQGLAETAQGKAEDAQTAAETAQGKAEDAQTAAEAAQSGAEDAQTAAEAAQDNSEDFMNSSEAWATGQIDGVNVPSDDPRYHNNSKYYSEVAEEESTHAAQSASEASSSASDASTYKSEARTAKTAAEAAQAAAEVAQNGALASKDAAQISENNARNYKEASEAWAVGQINGSDISNLDPRYHNNAKYYSQQSSGYANASEAWATGGAGGTPSGTNNALYYSGQSAASASEASGYASDAAASELGAAESMQESEAWATGTRGGEPVSIIDPTYHNNSHYYRDEVFAKFNELTRVLSQIDIGYQNNTDGHNPPTGGIWTTNPNPENGKFTWSRTVFTWDDGSTTVLHNVTYIGVNGTGAVDDVNGLAGHVILDAANIYYDAYEASPVTLKSLVGTITNAQIDALFDEEESL